MRADGGESVSARLHARVAEAIAGHGGWIGFDRLMAIALYEPGLGYYARGDGQFGAMPSSGSDFVTAPELTPLFGRALARQVGQALAAAQADTVYEFGAGSGALAAQLLEALGDRVRRYAIVDVSGALRERQRHRLAPWGGRVEWLDAWPDAMHGVVVGNEVLDAMPVQLLHWDGAAWHERGVASPGDAGDAALRWADRATALRPPHPGPYAAGAVVELPTHALAFVGTLADKLARGAAFFIDYGFPEAEYYHPQRSAGTLMCHRAHRAAADPDAPLRDLGLQDITAHVDFSAVALAAQAAGMDVIGYTSQAHFLINCGLPELLEGAGLQDRAAANRLLGEHEMGELFKAIALARGVDLDPIGFAVGDRSHRL